MFGANKLVRMPSYRWPADPQSYGFAPFSQVNFENGFDLEQLESNQFRLLSVKAAKYAPIVGTRFYHFQQFGYFGSLPSLAIAETIDERNVDLEGIYSRRAGNQPWAYPNSLLCSPKQLVVHLPTGLEEITPSIIADELSTRYPSSEVIATLYDGYQYSHSPKHFIPALNPVMIGNDYYWMPDPLKFIGGICKYVCFCQGNPIDHLLSIYISTRLDDSNIPLGYQSRIWTEEPPNQFSIAPIDLMAVQAEMFAPFNEYLDVYLYGEPGIGTSLRGWTPAELNEAMFNGTSFTPVSDIEFTNDNIIEAVIESVGDTL